MPYKRNIKNKPGKYPYGSRESIVPSTITDGVSESHTAKSKTNTPLLVTSCLEIDDWGIEK